MILLYISNNNKGTADLNRVINYAARHSRVTVLLVVHGLIKNHLYTELLSAPTTLYDIVNPILVEARPSQQGGLELCILLPLLTRLKEKLQASFFLCLNCVVTTNDFFFLPEPLWCDDLI